MSLNYSKKGNAAVITLNRPEYLNTLTFDMVEQIDSILRSIIKNDSILLVIFNSEGDRAFCAGGDVKSFYEEKFTDSNKLRKEFFYNEYRMNYIIKTYKKPIISLVNGICMGGGVGIAMHGTVIVVSENVTFAMPETAIGLFPDVGAGKILSSLKDDVGTYLALTGKRIESADLLSLSLAHYCCKKDSFCDIEERLSCSKNILEINENIKNFATKLDSKLFPSLNKEISDCFKFDTVEEIVLQLEKRKSSWAIEALQSFKKMSPTSLKVTLQQLRYAKNMTFEEDLIMEYRLSQGCMAGHDFYEGVRAVLVDKDRNPKWKPDRLEDVDNNIVMSHFESLGNNDLKFN